MKLTHFHRIRGHPTERFRVADVGNPLALEDPLWRATEVAMRSASVALLWGITGRLVHDQPAPRTLLAVRVLHAWLFAAMVGLGTGLAMACSPVPYPQLVCLPFLFVPTLPFFAMHFSETALLTSAYVLLASSLAVMFLDGPRAHCAGFPLGLSTALMLAGGRSPWPLAAVVAVVLGGRVLLGPSGRQGELRAAVVFWAGFALGGSAFYLLLNDAYRVMLLRYAAFAPAGLRSAGRWLIQQPLGMVGFGALGGGGRSLGGLRSCRRRHPLARRLALSALPPARTGARAAAVRPRPRDPNPGHDRHDVPAPGPELPALLDVLGGLRLAGHDAGSGLPVRPRPLDRRLPHWSPPPPGPPPGRSTLPLAPRAGSGLDPRPCHLRPVDPQPAHGLARAILDRLVSARPLRDRELGGSRRGPDGHGHPRPTGDSWPSSEAGGAACPQRPRSHLLPVLDPLALLLTLTGCFGRERRALASIPGPISS